MWLEIIFYQQAAKKEVDIGFSIVGWSNTQKHLKKAL